MFKSIITSILSINRLGAISVTNINTAIAFVLFLKRYQSVATALPDFIAVGDWLRLKLLAGFFVCFTPTINAI